MYENELKNIVIAYEPIWAIGTGKSPTLKQIEEVSNIIRNQIHIEFSEKASKSIKVLYGGSVNTQNAKSFTDLKTINGLLVGGASLNASDFAKICNL